LFVNQIETFSKVQKEKQKNTKAVTPQKELWDKTVHVMQYIIRQK